MCAACFFTTGVFPVYQKGREHDVLEFIMAAFDCIDREFKQYDLLRN